jgi:hypothetical protein
MTGTKSSYQAKKENARKRQRLQPITGILQISAKRVSLISCRDISHSA